jgi:hypothetical protein
MPQRTEPSSSLLDRVRKLLAQAEGEGVTQPEAEAFTARAAELMARHGIDRAKLAADRPETDRPGSRVIDVRNPWAKVRAHLLAGLAGAMRCQCVLLSVPAGQEGARVHVFGYASDLERTDILYTSLLLQMGRAFLPGGRALAVPEGVRSVRAWHRSWLLGYVTAVITRVQAAEARVTGAAKDETTAGGKSTALVLADRSVVIRRDLEEAYPVTRRTRITYSGRGYTDGYAQGQRADIGNARLGNNQNALSRS